MVINGLAVILTVYIMAPVAQDAFDILEAKKPDLKNIESVKESVIACMEPLKKFLVKHTHMKERKFFVETAKFEFGIPRSLSSAAVSQVRWWGTEMVVGVQLLIRTPAGLAGKRQKIG